MGSYFLAADAIVYARPIAVTQPERDPQQHVRHVEQPKLDRSGTCSTLGHIGAAASERDPESRHHHQKFGITPYTP